MAKNASFSVSLLSILCGTGSLVMGLSSPLLASDVQERSSIDPDNQLSSEIHFSSQIQTIPDINLVSEPTLPPFTHLQTSATTIEMTTESVSNASVPLTEESLPTLTFNSGNAKDLAPSTQISQIIQAQGGEMVAPGSETTSPNDETTETETPVSADTEEEAKLNPYLERSNTFYVTLYGVPIQGRESAQDHIGRATFDLGYGLGGAVGYRFNNSLRAEVEYSYFDNGFQDLFFFIPETTTVAPNQPEQSPGATVTGRAIMVNAYYDFPVSERFRPYIGAGIGTYNATINDLSPPGFGGFVANGDSADRFAFQLRAGISYLFTPNFEVFTGYRYFKGKQFEYIIENTGTPPLVLRPNGLESNSWEIGLRYYF